MKYLFYGLYFLCFLASCKNEKSQIVGEAFADSLIRHYSNSPFIKTNEEEMKFWESRLDSKAPGITNESRYASTLIGRFHQFGDIDDIKQAEKIMYRINSVFNEKEAAPFVALTRYSLLQHRFNEAESFLQKAKRIGLRSYESSILSFDVDFELGKYSTASFYLTKIKSRNDYGYFFRKAKIDHLNGSIDSAIDALEKAAELSKSSPYLKQAALTNAADLYIHAGDLQKASDLYVGSLRANSSDFHSLLGLGWIAAIHDRNYALAERLFKFVQTKNKLPDATFKLYQLAQGKSDLTSERKYAEEFVLKSTKAEYGNMYTKYLIELYTGILKDYRKAESLSKKELSNRATPQTYAWYAWSLFKNNKKNEAYAIFKQRISGKPLEGLELYYMGKLMQGLGKGYNANEFFKAANANYYDLSPAFARDLKSSLEK
jgi:hypothetical protein